MTSIKVTELAVSPMGSTSIEDGVKGIEADLFSSLESPTTCDIGGKICTPISSSGGVRSFDLT